MAVDVGQIMDIGILPKGMRRRKSQSTAQIYIDELMEEYTCPICFDEINKCMMTHCGHNFCKECIEECLNRKHICPLCSTKTTADKLVRNVHLDSVLAKLVNARQAASQQLVQNLMQKTFAQNSSKITTESPIAQIFTKYTSQTLVKYENYYQEMLRDHNKTQLKLQEKLRVSLTSSIKPLKVMENKIKKKLQPKQPGHNHKDNGNENDSESDHDIKMDDNEQEEMEMVVEGGGDALNNETQELFTNILCVEGNEDEYIKNLKKSSMEFCTFIKSKKEELSLSDVQLNEIEANISTFNAEMELAQKRVDRSCKLLFESYEEYMKKTGPSPFLLPVSITIRLRGRPQHWDLKLNATDRIGAVIEIVKKKFVDLGDPIKKFEFDQNSENDMKVDGDGNNKRKIRLGILRPLGHRDPQKPLEIISNLESCLSELNVRQGTQIHVLTTFMLKSEAPRPCFTYNYKKENNAACDYYRCKTCGFNWVCAACSIQCHKGHELVVFMKAHIPSYACCYCVKKKKCKILNIKSKKK